MVTMVQLALPIALAAAAVWFASLVICIALPHHKRDYKKLPDEEGFAAYIRSSGIPTGGYQFPLMADKSQFKDPEFMKRLDEGPLGMLTVWGKINMGRSVLLSFVVYLVVSALIGYLGAAALQPGASAGKVFQVMGTAGVLAYSVALIPNGIWFQAPPRALVMNVIDGIAYGLITGAVFAGLWPGPGGIG